MIQNQVYNGDIIYKYTDKSISITLAQDFLFMYLSTEHSTTLQMDVYRFM